MSSRRTRVLVTGGTGFLGRPLVERLATDGCRVVVLDRGPGEGAPAGAETLVEGDLADPATLAAALDGIDVLYHLACSTVPSTSAEHPAADVEENVLGSVRLFEAAAERGVRKIVYPSSGGTVYGVARRLPIAEEHPAEPISVHGATKLATERLLSALALQRGYASTILRIANPYGPDQWRRRSQGILGALLRAVATGEPVTVWGDGSVVRDFLALEDAVAALAAARRLGDGEVLNVGSGRGHSIRDLLDVVERVTEAPVPVRWREERGFDVPANVLDPGRAREVLSWRPRTSLEEGVRGMWAAYPGHASGAADGRRAGGGPAALSAGR